MKALLPLREQLEAGGYQVALQLLAPGTIFAAHCPCVARFEVVFAGRLQVVIAGHTHVLGPGDWIDIPAGVPVTAEVLGEEPVLCLDAALDQAAA
ncbi:MAG: cupin domain-containing protein [Gammaproteobacteria bacterium]